MVSNEPAVITIHANSLFFSTRFGQWDPFDISGVVGISYSFKARITLREYCATVLKNSDGAKPAKKKARLETSQSARKDDVDEWYVWPFSTFPFARYLNSFDFSTGFSRTRNGSAKTSWVHRGEKG